MGELLSWVAPHKAAGSIANVWWRISTTNLPCDDSWLFVCWSFMFWQHLKSYQEGYRLVTVCTHDNCIGLFHWETRLAAPCPDIPPIHIILTLNQLYLAPILIMPSTWLGSDKYNVLSHWILSHWIDSTSVWTHEFKTNNLLKRETDTYLTHLAISTGNVMSVTRSNTMRSNSQRILCDKGLLLWSLFVIQGEEVPEKNTTEIPNTNIAHSSMLVMWALSR